MPAALLLYIIVGALPALVLLCWIRTHVRKRFELEFFEVFGCAPPHHAAERGQMQDRISSRIEQAAHLAMPDVYKRQQDMVKVVPVVMPFGSVSLCGPPLSPMERRYDKVRLLARKAGYPVKLLGDIDAHAWNRYQAEKAGKFVVVNSRPASHG